MKIKEISSFLEKIVLLSYAEGFDNVGLLVVDRQKKISKGLITLDCSKAVVEEVIEKRLSLLLLFSGYFQRFKANYRSQLYPERVALKRLSTTCDSCLSHLCPLIFSGLRHKIF